ncbi:hypothetical protein D5S18_05785 [Nocardia panacis]|uniref:HTH iclR-type domain-containing protein n=1 Tax=Nocardia panacis TaxID=2340916 RepID=A0A3A4KGG1_9NOCA|nr:helix-turn-helix domain-containing protein [Nocardia panacis]RJO78404.1 hypothetical protein D5S18_05785 [Nocardia panacis]
MNRKRIRVVACLTRLGPNQRAVLHCLGDGVARSVAEIAARTGKSDTQVRSCLPSLWALRYVRPVPATGWAIAPDGVRAAALLRTHWR